MMWLPEASTLLQELVVIKPVRVGAILDRAVSKISDSFTIFGDTVILVRKVYY